MKKLSVLFGRITTVLLIVFTILSCSTDNEDNSYFTLGIYDATSSFKGSVDAVAKDKVTLSQYEANIEKAYWDALGMKNGNTLVLSGDYEQESTQLKAKFNSVSLPTPQLSYQMRLLIHSRIN